MVVGLKRIVPYNPPRQREWGRRQRNGREWANQQWQCRLRAILFVHILGHTYCLYSSIPSTPSFPLCLSFVFYPLSCFPRSALCVLDSNKYFLISAQYPKNAIFINALFLSHLAFIPTHPLSSLLSFINAKQYSLSSYLICYTRHHVN